MWSLSYFFLGFLLPTIAYDTPSKLSRQGLLVITAREGYKALYKRLVSELAPQSNLGAYVRPAAQFSISKQTALASEGRYHLYVGNPCPWCHRVTLAHAILGLSSKVTVSQLDDNPLIATKGGWVFDNNRDPVFGARDLKEIYDTCYPGYSGKVTAPLLVDKRSRKIVSNESKDIVKMLGSWIASNEDDSLVKPIKKIRPIELSNTIDAKNDWLYQNFNNAVYRAGFATEQTPYDEAVSCVSKALASIDLTLSQSKFLNGDIVTESDIFLLPTVVRFDAIYAVLFKCTGKRIADYEHIQRWVREMYTLPGVAATFDLKDASRSYYQQMFPLNPSRIVPQVIIPSYLQI